MAGEWRNILLSWSNLIFQQDLVQDTDSVKMASTSFQGSSGRNVTGLPPVAPNLASSLPQLTSETELQKLLADERMRSQMHKTNYEQLKEEHKRFEFLYYDIRRIFNAVMQHMTLQGKVIHFLNPTF